MEPVEKTAKAYILEFKVFDPEEEKTLSDTADASLKHFPHIPRKENLIEIPVELW